ncbi:hypothetical protein FQA39_LY01837 [Lamprigera yunnana]|nr:hypothetical protein FQA39_LY01837 [Lamprigera yunnana]
MDRNKVDGYIQKVEEFVCDEDKIVTVPWLATILGINANDTKTLLEQYVAHFRKSLPGSLTIVYVISGLRDGHLSISLATEDELDDKKELYSGNPIVEIYSVQKAKVTSLNGVALVDHFNTHDTRGVPILGSIISRNCIKRNFKAKKPLPAPPPPTLKEKKSFFTKLPPKTNTTGINNGATKAKTNIEVAQSTKSALDRFLVNGTQKASVKVETSLPNLTESKPKSQITSIIDSESEEEEAPSQKVHNEVPKPKQKTTRKVSKKKESTSKRRKRIVVQEESDDDIFADDDNDDEEEMSRKRKNVITDSDEEQPVAKPESPPVPRNKKRKLVDHTYEDEEGYIVTERKWVEVDDEEEKEDEKTEVQFESKIEKAVVNGKSDEQVKKPSTLKTEKSSNVKAPTDKTAKMDRSCICVADEIILTDFSGPIETEDIDEIDSDELIEDPTVSEKSIWEELCFEFYQKRQQIEDYIQSKVVKCTVPDNPAIQFFEENFAGILRETLVATLNKAKELDAIKNQKQMFSPLDYIAEMLWNRSPRHPERANGWVSIFDMDWAIEWLKHHSPRPYYPLSWVWTDDFAATKIQAYVRGYWVRCRADIQEMRQFWIVFIYFSWNFCK